MGNDIERVTDLPAMPKRERATHKGDFGRVLIVGGSRGMIGAVAMAANSAFRGGAGLVTFAAPAGVQLTIAGLCPCATSIPLADDGEGNLVGAAVDELRQAADRFDVIAVGPGMSTGDVQQGVVRALLQTQRPLVIDADGLNNLAHIDDWASLRAAPLVLTPHPGEFGRLTGKAVKDIQSSREASAVEAVRAWANAGSAAKDRAPLVVALKGDRTVVTDGRRVYVNDTGNPGLATGGTGDVLTGLVAALMGQGLSAFDAARLGVWAHGRAGDLAVQTLGQVSMMAWDLLDYLPAAIRVQSAGMNADKR